MIAWKDERSGFPTLYAKGIKFDGDVAWGGKNGIQISDSVIDPESISMISSGENNSTTDVVISWAQNTYTSSRLDIFAQRIDPTGKSKWKDKGIAVCRADNTQWEDKIIKLNEGGQAEVLIVWADERNLNSSGSDIYAQKVRLDGSFEWQNDGVPVSTAGNDQRDPFLIGAGNGKAISAWTDSRTSSESPDVYGQLISANGISGLHDNGGSVTKRFELDQNYPNPFNPSTTISYRLATADHVTLKVYDVLGREVATLVDASQNAGYHSAQFDGIRLPTGVYFYKLTAGSYSVVKKLALLK